MRSPQYVGNGRTPSPTPQHQHNHNHHFQSTVSVTKLRRFNTLILVFRFASFCFSLSCAIFMGTNTNWQRFPAFRYVLAANAIVAFYSFLQMGASFWEICTGNTLFPETLHLWFDFGHDQVFAYMVLSADAAGAAVAWGLSKSEEQRCTATTAFCIQSYISIALGFAGFLFLGFSCLLSGFRVVCFIIHGSRFHL